MSTLTIVSSANATNALAVNFAAIAFFRSGVGGTNIEYISGKYDFVTQSVSVLISIFPNAVRLDDCNSLRDEGGNPTTVYVNPSAVVSVQAFTNATEGCNLQVLGREAGLQILQPFSSVIAKF